MQESNRTSDGTHLARWGLQKYLKLLFMLSKEFFNRD